LAAMKALGPKNVIITDGPNGAYALEENGSTWKVPMYPDPKPPYERTGAGDAFSSSVVSALALGKPMQEALLWGPVNSMAVVQEIGAQRGLLSREKLEEYLAQAPAEFKVSSL
jgi:sugar/nucleoside kinase (ribokinase family)